MANSPFSSGRFKIAFGIVLLIIAVNHEVILTWYKFPFKVALIDALVSTTHLALAMLLMINTMRYYLPQKNRLIYLVAWCVILTCLIIVFDRWALTSFLRKYEDYILFFDNSLIIRVSLYLLITGVAALLSMIWYQLQEQKETDNRNRETEEMVKEAELFKLRQQLQPHFLFNSLNSINALIGSRPEEARKMVQQLSDFLRGTLKKEEHQWMTLNEELQYLQLYLEIEKVRFGHRLSTQTDIADAVKEYKLPALLLQPIVENAIKFGLYDTTGETVIQLSARAEEDNLVIRVINPFDPETSSPGKGTGFGLQSIRRRLYLLFARNDLLTTDVKENNFITTVKIPQS